MRLLPVVLVLSLTSCRTMMRRPPGPDAATQPAPVQTEPQPDVSNDPPSPEVAAIIDSIQAVVRDSIAAAADDSIQAAAARDEAIAAARRDSIEAAAQAEIAAALRRDSIAAVVRRDSIEAAARDSIAAVARRDSVAAALADSLAAIALRDSMAAAIEEARATAPISEDLEELRQLGPAYIPYDEGPRVFWDTESQANLTKALLPVVRAEDLTARTRAYFWLLVTADGTVDQVVLQTSSGNAPFDETAEEVARELLFRPAMRAGRAVPTWVVRDISLVM